MDGQPEVWPVEERTFYAHLLRTEQGRLQGPSDPREHKLCSSWIVRACSDYGFRESTASLAVEYWAAFIKSARKSNPRHLTFKQLIVKVAGNSVLAGKHKESQICELMCICCIAISAKKLEPKEKAPYLGDFDENFTFDELRAMESTVLFHLEFNLTYATPLDFSEFWLSRTSPFVDRKGLKTLIHEAISAAVADEFYYLTEAHDMGTAANIWAHYALELDTTEFEAEVMNTTNSKGGLSESLLMAVESIGKRLSEAYPHAYKPYRASSPANAMDIHHHVFSGEPAAKCLKRPIPEKFSKPNAKQAKK